MIFYHFTQTSIIVSWNVKSFDTLHFEQWISCFPKTRNPKFGCVFYVFLLIIVITVALYLNLDKLPWPLKKSGIFPEACRQLEATIWRWVVGGVGLGRGCFRCVTRHGRNRRVMTWTFPQKATLPETNIAPENWWLEDYFPFGKTCFQVLR